MSWGTNTLIGGLLTLGQGTFSLAWGASAAERLLQDHPWLIDSMVVSIVSALTLLLLWGDQRRQIRQLRRAHRQQLRAIETERAQLRTLLHALPDLVWMKDPQGVYVFCNPGFEPLCGAPESEVIGQTDDAFVDKAIADAFRRDDGAAAWLNWAVMSQGSDASQWFWSRYTPTDGRVVFVFGELAAHCAKHLPKDAVPGRFVSFVEFPTAGNGKVQKHLLRKLATTPAAADAQPQDLYETGDGRFEFDRTVSRLIEMRSEAYLALPHGQRDSQASAGTACSPPERSVRPPADSRCTSRNRRETSEAVAPSAWRLRGSTNAWSESSPRSSRSSTSRWRRLTGKNS